MVGRDILCSDKLIQTRDAHFVRMTDLFHGNRVGRPFTLFGTRGNGVCDPYTEPEKWITEAIDDLAAKADAIRDQSVFRPLVIEFGPYGVHFTDRILGAEVYELEEKWNWQAHYLSTPIGELKPPDLETDETWVLARRLADAFLEAGVSVPLFGLPTIASALNVALNLYGQEMLIAMRTDPDAARHDLKVINDLLCEMHCWYREHIPNAQLQPVLADWRTQPPGYGQLCGCSTQLLSPDGYAQFVDPLDDELLSVYPNGGMIHLCGGHKQHIPVWREMRSLRSLQLNDRAAGDLETYFNELRDDQVFYVNPCPEMPISEIMRITDGQRVVIVADGLDVD